MVAHAPAGQVNFMNFSRLQKSINNRGRVCAGICAFLVYGKEVRRHRRQKGASAGWTRAVAIFDEALTKNR
jgi:hypothetical protein